MRNDDIEQQMNVAYVKIWVFKQEDKVEEGTVMEGISIMCVLLME